MSKISDIYQRIAADERPEVFITLRAEAEVEAEYAASLAAGGPLAGVVLAVKDNVDVAGLPITAACPGFSFEPTADAAAVAALRAAGAVVIGKTNLDQFATGLVGSRSPYGAVRGALRPEHISGGSSSGSGVAVALHYADIAIGTDTAGSGRVPAALNGIVGIKPTVGVVSNDGVVPACPSYDCVTIFARDLPTANVAMAQLTRERDVAGPLAAPPDAVLGVPTRLPQLNDAWLAAFDSAVEQARAAGIRTVSVGIDELLAAGRLLYDGALVAERFASVGDFLTDAGPDAGLDPTVTTIIGSAAEIPAPALVADQQRLKAFSVAADELFASIDGLLLPTVPRHPTLAEVAADPAGVNAEIGVFTTFCNLLDLCAVAVPAGTVADGAQFGVSVIAPAGHDAVALDLAGRIVGAEALRPWNASDGIELAVFGAHLRGQPLEHQLTSRGARWVGPIATAAGYRLVALATAPPKPGLVHDQAAGRSIRGELWSLTPAALGEFLAELPEPMTLGAIRLDDGRTVVGFGCQQSAIAAAAELDTDHWLERPVSAAASNNQPMTTAPGSTTPRVASPR